MLLGTTISETSDTLALSQHCDDTLQNVLR